MAVIIHRRWDVVVDVSYYDMLKIRAFAEDAHVVFVKNGWTYGYENPHVPTVDELAQCITGLWRTVNGHGYGKASSGRFKVTRALQDGHVTIGWET